MTLAFRNLTEQRYFELVATLCYLPWCHTSTNLEAR